MATLMPGGYRSASEYCFREEQAEAIVKAAAYHRKDFSQSMIWFSPREHDGILSSIATPFQRTSDGGLGPLDRLPPELLHNILLCVDMHSLFNFRQTSLKSRQLVDSLNQYQRVVSFGLNLLCALMRTRLATCVSLLDFYDALCIKTCTLCGEFGGFVSLLTWRRCCFPCSRTAPETHVQTRAAAEKLYRLSMLEPAQQLQLRSFKTLPGTYTMEQRVYKARVTVVSAHQARLLFGHRAKGLGRIPPASSRPDPRYDFMGSCALPYYDKRNDGVEHGMSCAGCQLALENGIIGSMGEKWALEARDKVYAQDGFLHHFRWCEQAQLLWESSGEGSSEPAELPKIARRGGFFYERQ